MTRPSIETAQAQLTDIVMSFPGVVGTGIGACDGAPCIKVFVARRTAALASRIPATYKGYTVKIEETGEFRAL